MVTDVKCGVGSHLMLDCFGCPQEKLSEIGFICDFLDGFPQKIGMTKLAPPSVFKYQGKIKEDWGISGVVMIAESHISVHTFPEKRHAFIDIFSRTEFDLDNARRILLEMFSPAHDEITLK